MSSPLAALGKLLAPPPRPPVDAPFEGTEYRWKMFVFRPAHFKTELLFFLVVLGYFIWSFVGKAINKSIAASWARYFKEAANHEVALVSTFDGSPVLADGATDFLHFASGRRGMESVHGIVYLRPRHDVFQSIMQAVWSLIEFSYDPSDKVELDFKLTSSTRPEAASEFVWAAAKKSEMAKLRKGRWDLTFTKVMADAKSVPPTFSTMAEVHDLNETLIKGKDFGIVETLSTEGASKYLQYIIITDQPTERPKAPLPAAERERHLQIGLILPPSGKLDEVRPIIEAAFNLVDVLHRGVAVSPDITRRLRKIRAELDDDLAKEAKARVAEESGESAEDKNKAAKRAAEEARLAKLTPEQRRKTEEKERKAALKKQHSKMMRRR